MSHVWEHSEVEGGALLVLLALADFANDKGVCWPSMPTLADKARLSERQTRSVIRQLEKAGEIKTKKNGGPNGVNLYKITVSGGENISPGKYFPRKWASPKPSYIPTKGSNTEKSKKSKKEDNSKTGGEKTAGVGKFVPPSVEEVREYFESKEIVDADLEADAFVEYWNERGWFEGSWKRRVATWAKNSRKFGTRDRSPASKSEYSYADALRWVEDKTGRPGDLTKFFDKVPVDGGKPKWKLKSKRPKS